MKILLFCKDNCNLSDRAIDYLKKYNINLLFVKSKSRFEKIPSEFLTWKGDYIFSFQSYFYIPIQLIKNSTLAVNFHPGPPEYPGSGMVNWALYDDCKKFGVTAHIMNNLIDNGRIIKVIRL
tara:strand:+ start:284 stop:649 length:366 start_codon:yes stop_codon:yes gene_type:complete